MKRIKFFTLRTSTAALLAICAWISTSAVRAAQVGTFEWTGAVSGNWNDPGNWSLVDGIDADGNGLPNAVGASSELVVFHATGAGNLSTTLVETRTIGALHFNSNASSTITIGGLQGNGVADDLAPVRLILDSATPPSDFYPVDILVPTGQNHVIQGAVQGTTSGDEGLQFYGPQVWQIDDGASLNFDVRVRQVSNSATSYQKTGDGTLILSQNNGGSGAWQFAGSSNPIKAFSISGGTVQLAVTGARGATSNAFRVESGATLQLAPGVIYGTINGAMEFNGAGFNGQGAYHLLGGSSSVSSGVGTFTLAGDTTFRVDNNSSPGVLDIQHPIQGPGGLTKTGPGTLRLSVNSHVFSGNTVVNEGTLLLFAGFGGGTIPNSPIIQVDEGATLDVSSHGSGFVVGPSIAQTLKGDGDVTGSVVFNPGSSLAVDYNGSQIDSLTVSGSLDITNATVDFNNLGSPLTAGAHVFATYGSLVGGMFAGTVDLPGGFTIDYDYLGGNQIALVGGPIPGDFNSDGNVDGTDFGIWQMNFPTSSGAMLGTGDGDGDGDVDGADFVVWQTNFPFMSAAASSVPEPATWMLALVGGTFALLRFRRKA
jgi:autotransporter-associated beta strand protein